MTEHSTQHQGQSCCFLEFFRPIALRKRNVIQLSSDEKFKCALLFLRDVLFIPSLFNFCVDTVTDRIKKEDLC